MEKLDQGDVSLVGWLWADRTTVARICRRRCGGKALERLSKDPARHQGGEQSKKGHPHQCRGDRAPRHTHAAGPCFKGLRPRKRKGAQKTETLKKPCHWQSKPCYAVAMTAIVALQFSSSECVSRCHARHGALRPRTSSQQAKTSRAAARKQDTPSVKGHQTKEVL